jgi:hypothetical protein
VKTRLTLQTELENILGSSNVYYNPPENKKMKFPCIVYKLEFIDNKHANNNKYIDYTTYKIYVISKDVDHPAVKAILNLPSTRFVTRYTRDGLYHDIINLIQKEKQ